MSVVSATSVVSYLNSFVSVVSATSVVSVVFSSTVSVITPASSVASDSTAVASVASLFTAELSTESDALQPDNNVAATVNTANKNNDYLFIKCSNLLQCF